MSSPKPPAPADPRVTAAAQTSLNIGTSIAQAELNNVNQVTPDGSLTYEQTGTYEYVDPIDGAVHNIPQYTATTALSESQQAQRDATDRAELNLANLAGDQSERLGNILGENFNPDNLPARGDVATLQNNPLERLGASPELQNSFDPGGAITRSYGTDFSEDRQRVEDAVLSRLQPGIEEDRRALDARLAGQGIRPGSRAYELAMDEASRGRNDARVSAILGAGQEHSRLTGLEAQRAQFENAAQLQGFGQNAALAEFGNQAAQQSFQNDASRINQNNQASSTEFNQAVSAFDAQNNNRASALQEEYAFRNQPINEITALLSGSQVSNPSFVNTPTNQIATTDFAGIQQAYDAQRASNFQQEQAGRNQLISGGLGFASNLLLSDERAKENVEKVGKTDDGQNLYKYNYIGDNTTQVGLMAQEVEKKNPDAVTTLPSGLKAVDYDKALKLDMRAG